MLTISSDCLSSCFCPDEVAFCRSFDSSRCQECFQSNIKVCVWQTDILTSYWKAQCIFYSTLCFFSLFHSVWNTFLNLHLIQDLHSGLEINSCCIWHQDFLFILRLSHLWKLERVSRSERRLDSQRCLEAHLVVAIDPPLMLCWFGVPECFGLLELSCGIGTTVNQSPKRLQAHSWACAAADYTPWHKKCFESFLY